MKKDNENGFALAWVVSVMMILMVIVCISMALAASFHKGVINSLAQKQAYLTARSAAEIIASDFTGSTGSGRVIADKIVTLLEADSSMPIKFELRGAEESMGSCDAVASYDSDSRILTVTVTATKGGETYRLKLYLKNQFQPIHSDSQTTFSNNWEVIRYSGGGYETYE